MIIKKTLLATIFSTFFTLTALANNYTTDYNVINNDELFKVTGTLPIVTTNNDTLNKELNQNIDEAYRATIHNAKNGNITKLDFSYDEIISTDYVSIVLYSNITNLGTTTYTNTFTFNKDTMTMVNINDFSQIIPSSSLNSVNKATANISTNVNSSTIDNSFYIENDTLVLVSSAGAGNGLEYKKIPLNLLKTYTLPKEDYYLKSNYQITMIPLRVTLESLGYDVIYTTHTNPIEIIINDETYFFTLNDNKYYSTNEDFTILEVAPEIQNNTTYVPISFLSDFLNISYKINEDESITFGNIK